jgi:dihydrofolate reductase
MLINLIAAMCHNNGIGYKGKLQWKIKADLQHFSKLTRGKGCSNAIVMGHTTWAGLNLPEGAGLSGRDTFILTSTVKFHKITKDGHLIKTFHNSESLIAFCKLMEYEELWICGGEKVYKQFLSEDNIVKINKCYFTYIDKAFECDTFFPDIDFTRWKEIDRKREYDLTYECNVDYCVYANSYTLC